MKTNWSFDLPINGTKEQHIAIKNTLEAIGYEWCGTKLLLSELDWGHYVCIVQRAEEKMFGGSKSICKHHFPSLLDFLVWHFTGEEENKEQKEIRDIRSEMENLTNQMEKLTERLKQLEDK